MQLGIGTGLDYSQKKDEEETTALDNLPPGTKTSYTYNIYSGFN